MGPWSRKRKREDGTEFEDRLRLSELPAFKFKLNMTTMNRAPMEYLTYLEDYNPAFDRPQTVPLRYPFESIVAVKQIMIVNKDRTQNTYPIVFVDIRPIQLEFNQLSQMVQNKLMAMAQDTSLTIISTVHSSAAVADQEDYAETGEILKSVIPSQELMSNLRLTPPVLSGSATVSYYPFPVHLRNLNAPAVRYVAAKLKEWGQQHKLSGTDSIRSLHSYPPSSDVYVHYYWNWTSLFLNYYKSHMFHPCTEGYSNDDYFEISPAYRLNFNKDVNSLRGFELKNTLNVLMVPLSIEGTFEFEEVAGFTSTEARVFFDKDKGEDFYLDEAAYKNFTTCGASEYDTIVASEMQKCVNPISNASEVVDSAPPMNLGLPSYMQNLQSVQCTVCPTLKYYLDHPTRKKDHYEYHHYHLKVPCGKCKTLILKFPYEMDDHDAQFHTLTVKKAVCDLCGKSLLVSNQARHRKRCNKRPRTKRQRVRRVAKSSLQENSTDACAISSSSAVGDASAPGPPAGAITSIGSGIARFVGVGVDNQHCLSEDNEDAREIESTQPTFEKALSLSELTSLSPNHTVTLPASTIISNEHSYSQTVNSITVSYDKDLEMDHQDAVSANNTINLVERPPPSTMTLLNEDLADINGPIIVTPSVVSDVVKIFETSAVPALMIEQVEGITTGTTVNAPTTGTEVPENNTNFLCGPQDLLGEVLVEKDVSTLEDVLHSTITAVTNVVA